MHSKKYKKILVFALVLTMLVPLGSMSAYSTDDEADTAAADTETADGEAAEEGDAAAEDEEEGGSKKSKKKQELVDPITDKQAVELESCEEYASNDQFVLYGDQDNDRICIYYKDADYYLWTSPINVHADKTVVDVDKDSMMQSAKRDYIGSSAAIKVGELEKRTESPAPVYSSKARSVKYAKEKGGLKVTYDYSSQGVKLVVHYQLEKDCLYVYCDTDEITEKNTDNVDGKVLTKLQLCPAFGAVPQYDDEGNETEGYMIVPDGSGAVINYNNGKGDYAEYSQLVYGRDYTAVPLTAPRVTEQAYLPVMASVNGNRGFVAIVTDGDTNVYAKAKVSLQDKQVYNNIYYEFETRSMDSFFMSGDNSNKITVFEKNGIKTPRFGIRYYPIAKDEDINYADCAEVYRNYLTSSDSVRTKLEKRATADTNDMYVDFFGGVMKQTSILGLPFDLKTEITGFDQAAEIISKMQDMGVSDTVVNYNDWTNKSIKQKVSTKAKASGTLGGNSDFKKLVDTSGLEVFPSMNNFTMKSGSWGYSTFNNTAIRISNAYSRQSEYSPAYGVAVTGVSPALVAPNSYVKIFDQMIESYKDKGLTRIAFGDYSTKLVSDFSKKNASSRYATANTIADGFKKADEEVGDVLCAGANAYVIPYASQITDVPVCSSGFNVTDMDIPFYQMVIHGYVPYSTKGINQSSNTSETFMMALAGGSGIHYDFIYEDASVLKDTDYDDLYYTNYEGWIDMAVEQYKVADKVLKGVSDMTISKYEVSEDGNVITTTYSKDGKDVVIEINKEAQTAKVDGQTIDLANALEGGAEG